MPTLDDLTPERRERVDAFLAEIKEAHQANAQLLPVQLLTILGNYNILVSQLLVRAEHAEQRLDALEEQ